MNRRRHTRRGFLRRVGLGAAAVATQRLLSAAETKGPRPNVLWLISEDTCPEMACYGSALVSTPNLDRLAAQGARFTQAFATGPVCSAVRSGLMTGMYQTSIGAHQHRTADKKPLPAPARLLTAYFREAGYFTCNCAGLNRKRRGKTDWNFRPAGKPFDGTDYSQRKPGQPFFAQANFSLTHRNFRRDRENPIDPAKVKLPPYYPDHPLARRDWADYLESVQVLDRQIGQALRRLEDEKLAHNTIVFYFGDHGRPHVRGKQWLYEGGIHIPLIVRWPAHVKPGTVVDDLVSSIDLGPTALSLAGVPVPGHMQGQVFLGPGAKKRQFVVAARDRCDETADRIRCIRTKRHKYIRNFHPDRPYTQFNAYKTRQYPVLTLMHVLHRQGKLTPAQARFMAPTRPKEELYDLQADPHELHNLAADAGHRAELERLRGWLDAWIKETGDRGETPESPQAVARWKQGAQRRHAQTMRQRGLPADASHEQQLEYWEKKLLGSPSGKGK